MTDGQLVPEEVRWSPCGASELRHPRYRSSVLCWPQRNRTTLRHLGERVSKVSSLPGVVPSESMNGEVASTAYENVQHWLVHHAN
jgi:hypothetical protein